MAVEIERKFLVDSDKWSDLLKPALLYCSQSYLLNEINKNVRVRVLGDVGFITIKSKKTDISRNEYEYQIPFDEAIELIKLCDQSPIEKNRYLIEYDGNIWEVDVFLGSNEGLIVAEIELKSEDQLFSKPDWITIEVSDDPKYYNSNLQNNPFSKW